MKLDFPSFAKAIEPLGREITMECLSGTRALIEPHLTVEPFEGVIIKRDVKYGKHERNRLDVFTPEKPDADRPLLVFVHGGGFIMGDKHTSGSPFYDNVGVWAVRHGFNAVNLTYRLAPESVWPSGIEDLQQAIALLKSGEVSEIGKADKLFLMGQSAGGYHVSSYLAYKELYAPEKHGVTALILISGMYDFTTMPITEKEKSYLGKNSAVYAERSSIKGCVDTGVPMLVSMAEYDPDYFQTQCMQLLKAYHEKYKTMPHTVMMTGQNHLSGILYLGLEGDLLGPQLEYFIQRYS